MDFGWVAISLSAAFVVVTGVMATRMAGRTERLLHAHADNLRTLLDIADESVLLLADDGSLLEINDTGRRLFQLPREQLLGRNLFSLLPDDIARARRSALDDVLSSRAPRAGEDWRAGRCIAWRVHPVLQGEQPISRIWLFAKDVTRNRQFQAIEAVFQQFDRRLLHHQANLHELAQHLCDELLPLFSLSAVWIARNEPHHRLSPLAASGCDKDIVARVAVDIPSVGGSAYSTNPIVGALIHAEPRIVREQDADWVLLPPELRPAGCNLVIVLPIYVSDSVFGVIGMHGAIREDGALIALFDNLATIISHASLAFEAAYDQSRLRLYERVLASTGTAVFITDVNGHIAWINEAFVRVTGYAREEIIGRTPRVFSSGMHEREFFADMWDTLLGGRVWCSDIVNARRDGSHYVAHQTISPVQGGDGRISHFVSLLEDVTDQKRSTERLEHLASHDALTDLPNRLLFERNLPRTLALAQRRQTRCAVLFVDLDRFKPVNDRFGHAIGDSVLREIAGRLSASVRLSDAVSRHGGDEFVVLLPDLGEVEAAGQVAAKIIEAVARPVMIGDIAVEIGASIGIAVFPDDSDDGEVLVKLADEAMYRAKMEGRNGFRYHGG